jgi:ubiquinone/menaquinone biosynthesis C-methylase UbiE
MSEGAAYVLGSDDEEIARLDGQARSIAGATEALLRAAGIGGAMRVLDLGTGLGHVALLVAGLLDTEGSVLGVDQSGRLLEIAERRRVAAGAENVSFVRSDARTFTADEPFDAIVARLLLFHLPDREELLRRQLEALRPGGKMVVIEFDIGAMRAEPEVPLVTQVRGWIEAAFRSAGADPRIGARAGQLLRRTGFADVSTFGIQSYFEPSDPIGPLLCAGVARSLAAQIVAQGIADEAELGLQTLQARIAEAVGARDAVMLPPTVVGAWGSRRRVGVRSSSRAAPGGGGS